MKRFICAVLALTIAFCVCGCRRVTSSESAYLSEGTVQSAADGKINLLYCFGDSFNPYTAATQLNRNLSRLLYEPLVRVDNDYAVHNCLAESIAVEGNTCTVRLKGAYFTDGSAVTADDVVHSFNLAKGSNTVYASYFAGITAARSGGDTVVFSLANRDDYFENLLTFPILKAGTEGITDTDGVEIPPVGSGRYYIGEDGKTLLLNNGYYGKKGSITEINLINAPDSDSVSHYVEVGATGIYYTDISDGNIVRMSGKRTEVNLNHLIYIGINSSYGALQTKEMRYAISSALDRAAICQSAYYNNATPATGYFNPSFAETAPVQTLNQQQNLQITVENLGKIGYNSLDSAGFYSNSAGKHPQFTLLVNSENHSRVLAARLIAQQCAAAGIEINVLERTYAQYTELLAANNFQLYLGEIKISPNMDIAQLIVTGGTAAYGVGLEPLPEEEQPAAGVEETAQTNKPQEKTLSVSENMINSYRTGQSSLSDLAGTLITEMPQIPVCYRNGLLFYGDEISGGVEASADDIYYSIQDYTLN